MTTQFWGLHVQCYADFFTFGAVAVNKSLQSLLVETVPRYLNALVVSSDNGVIITGLDGF